MNQKSVIGLFEALTKIPHCSGKTHHLREWLVEFAKGYGYRVETDTLGNVMAYAPKSYLTLQSHYDMVCIGKAPKIQTVVEEGWIRAKESSLGADNGIGVAIMLYLLQKRAPIDALFTNDEEIGLLGAVGLKLVIRTPYLLNLDSEELGKVYIGCAGGEDLFARQGVAYEKILEGGKWYEVTASTPGGHSGVNIADGIANAITELCATLSANPAMRLGALEGGERINAIPRHAKALIWLPKEDKVKVVGEGVKVEALASTLSTTLIDGMRLARALFGFAHGVRAWNRALNLPQSSVNLAGIKLDEDGIEVSISARSMDNGALERLSSQCAAYWKALGFTTKKEGKYPAWKPEKSPFASKVLDVYRRHIPDARFAAIHACLECALFADRFEGVQIASIGPTILDPHSDRERVELASVEQVVAVVEELIGTLSSI